MVEELKHLSTHMDKVIVVSHLEAFRDRDNFPCQIHVTKEGNGSSIANVRY
jgi:DNA repair exonuclease SbcCD ATPase subunit